MDWKHANSLFIFVFLIMNIGLGAIYYNKVQQSKTIDTQDEKNLSFHQENIKLPDRLLVADGVKLNYVSGKSKVFNIDEKNKQKATVLEKTIDNTVTLSAIDPKSIMKDLEGVLQTIDNGSEYILSGIDRKNKQIYFEQMFNKYPILSNETAQIIFDYNAENEVTSYKQTYLEELQEGLGKNNAKKQVVSPRKALETLYYQNALKSGDEVSAVRLGYYSVMPNVEGQVLKPTWQVAIIHQGNTRETFYVDALKPEETILK